jgi:hypothetical protein
MPDLNNTPVEGAAPIAAPAASSPVTSPAPAPAAGSVEATTAEQQAAAERDEQGRFKSSAQERINELTRSQSAAQREADYWKTLATAKAPAPAPEAPKAPDVKDFAQYNDYVEALSTFKAEQIVEARLAKRDQEQASKESATKAVASYQSREAEVKGRIADYDATMRAADVPLTDIVGKAIFESERGPEIAYHLAKNPAQLEAMNKMNEKQVDREIGRLEARLDTASAAAATPSAPASPSPQAAPAAPAARTSSAPPPAKTAPAAAGNAPVDLSKLSMADYVKAREQQGASWARR